MMKTMDRHPGFVRTALVVAALAPFGLANAEDDKDGGSKAEGWVSVGGAAVSGDSADRSIFGQYNGLRTDSFYGLFDFEYFRRDEETGVWTQFRGRDVFLETRELDFLWKKQGDWRFTANYGELVRYEPYAVNTGMLGAGSATPEVVYLQGGVGTGGNLDLNTKRKGLGFAVSKWVTPSMEFQGSLKSENKDGARLFGVGFNCPSPTAPGCAPATGVSVGSAVLMVPVPINSNHSQVEGRLSYAGEKLRLSGGYYGSFFSNSNGALNPNVPGSLNNPVGDLQPLGAGLQPILSQAVALPPDNRAHHADMTGLYAFTPTTRANFKLGYARATQSQDFASAGLTGAPAGIANLGGEVNTKKAQLGITSRPMPKLSLLAEVNYDDRDDRTPLALYNVVGTTTFTNRTLPYEKTRGKVQASYQFSRDYRGTIGADYEAIDRGLFTPTSAVSGISALRQETEEIGYRAELRRRMSENFSGSISYVTSSRDGSGWLCPNSGLGVSPCGNQGAAVASTSIFMPTLADRQRDKVRLQAHWQPSKDWTLQFAVEDGQDEFTSPSQQGLQKTGMNLLSFDWDYQLSFRWNLNGYVSRGTQKLDQARPGGYIMAFDNESTTVGFGVVGKPTSKIEVGGTLSYFNDKNVYAQTLDPTASAGSFALLDATGGLPDIVFRTTELRLFGTYKLSDEASWRLDLVHQRADFNDWAYGYSGVPFVYSDNTTLTQMQKQGVTYLGLSYIHRWN